VGDLVPNTEYIWCKIFDDVFRLILRAMARGKNEGLRAQESGDPLNEGIPLHGHQYHVEPCCEQKKSDQPFAALQSVLQ
jgi:hypothetical protein